MDFLDKIRIPAAKEKQIRSYSFGEKWANEAVRAYKAGIYIDQELVKVSDGGSVVGRCCSEGNLVYQRKDGGGITDDDVTALLAINRGQINNVRTRTAKEVTIYWLCDSSD